MPQQISRALLTFISYSDPNFSAFVNRVISAQTGNPALADTAPLITELSALFEDFGKLLIVALGGDRVQIANKNAMREQMIGTLRRIVSQVNFIANGNRGILLSSGLIINSDLKKSAAPVPVSNMKAA